MVQIEKPSCKVREEMKKIWECINDCKWTLQRKERVKWYFRFAILELILWMCFFGYLDERIPNYATHVGDKAESQIIHDFTDDYIVEQQFESPRNFEYITLNFADHDMDIQGRMQIEIYDDQNNCLICQEINSREIEYAKYGNEVKLSFLDLGGGKAGHRYMIRLSAANTTDVALGLYGYEVEDGEEPAVINGQQSDMAVSIGIHSYTQAFKILATILMSICMLGMVVTIWFCTKEDVAEEKRFLTIVIPVGICMLLFLSTNNVYDANAHTATAYHYSNVILGIEGDDTEKVYVRMEDTWSGSEKSGTNNEQAQEYWRILQDWNWFSENDEIVPQSAMIAKGGSFFSYLPNTIGITLGRILKLGVYPMFYLAKLLGFLIYVVLCYWAIRVTPIIKTVFAFVAALPVCIYHATGITYDTMTLAAVLVMCSYIFLWWKRSLSIREWILFAVSVVFVGGCKGGVYLPLVLLIILVPLKRWNLSWKKITALFVFLSGGIGMFLVKYGDSLISGMRAADEFSNPSLKYGAGYCFKHPIVFVKMLMETLVIRGDAYLGHILSDRTAWTQSHVEWFVIVPFLILLFAAVIRKENEQELITNVRKIFCIFLLAAEFVGIHIVLMTDTRISESYIYGVQGRYFLQLVPLAVLVLRERGLVREAGKENKLYICWSMTQAVYMVSLMDKFF